MHARIPLDSRTSAHARVVVRRIHVRLPLAYFVFVDVCDPRVVGRRATSTLQFLREAEAKARVQHGFKRSIETEAIVKSERKRLYDCY